MKAFGYLILVLLAAVFILTACATEGAVLEDTVWSLESYGEEGKLKAVLPDTEVTAEFKSAEKQVSGSAGCNSYFGGYEVKGSELSITGPIGSTMMSCGEQIDKQEYEYLQALQAAESYLIENGKLRVNCGQKVLHFQRK
jgi:heat shock protein HslJ